MTDYCTPVSSAASTNTCYLRAETEFTYAGQLLIKCVTDVKYMK